MEFHQMLQYELQEIGKLDSRMKKKGQNDMAQKLSMGLEYKQKE